MELHLGSIVAKAYDHLHHSLVYRPVLRSFSESVGAEWYQGWNDAVFAPGAYDEGAFVFERPTRELHGIAHRLLPHITKDGIAWLQYRHDRVTAIEPTAMFIYSRERDRERVHSVLEQFGILDARWRKRDGNAYLGAPNEKEMEKAIIQAHSF